MSAAKLQQQKERPKEMPIIFSGPMVRAILAGNKTQTRRVIKRHAPEWTGDHWRIETSKDSYWTNMGNPAEQLDFCKAIALTFCPYGKVGDRLYVKETWAWPNEEFVLYRATDDHIQKEMQSDPNNPQFVWRPSIFMRREHSRITLEITGVRVERLQDISTMDIIAEGIPEPHVDLRNKWIEGWNKINGKRAGCAWKDSPFVWVIEFKKVEANL